MIVMITIARDGKHNTSCFICTCGTPKWHDYLATKKLIGPIGLKYLLLGKDRQVPPLFLTPLFFLQICNWKDLRWICSRGAVGGDKKAKFGLKSLIWLGVSEVAYFKGRELRLLPTFCTSSTMLSSFFFFFFFFFFFYSNQGTWRSSIDWIAWYS